MRPPRHHRHITVAAACAIGALSVLTALPAGVASASPRSIRAVPLGLPQDAATGNSSASNLFAIDCVRAGTCTGGGGYANRTSRFAAMVASQVNGRWQRAIELRLPPNSGGERLSEVESLDCAAAGGCTAVGNYSASDQRTFGFAARETGGRWGPAREIAVPLNASHGYGSGFVLSGVACTGPGTCLAVGQYEDTAGRFVSMAVTESGGRWSRATELSLPTDASRRSDQRTSLTVACRQAGFCTAVGDYLERSGDSGAMAISESGGKWQRPIELAAPTGASAYDGSGLDSVSCTGAGWCTAVGSYNDRSNNSRIIVVTESRGRWGRAHVVNALPRNADASQPNSLNSVSCVRRGDCIAVGTYVNKIGGTNIWIAHETAGNWVASTQVTLPTNASHGFFADDEAFDVDCTGSGYCAVGGDYNTKSFIQRAIVAAVLMH